MSDVRGQQTVGDFLDVLSRFPRDWPVIVSTPAGGGIAIEHREISGRPAIAIFGSNGGRFGENPLTEEEYQKRSAEFLDDLKSGRAYTSAHGDHRTYLPVLGEQASCYGKRYDRRIIERMVQDGLIPGRSVDIERVQTLDGSR